MKITNLLDNSKTDNQRDNQDHLRQSTRKKPRETAKRPNEKFGGRLVRKKPATWNNHPRWPGEADIRKISKNFPIKVTLKAGGGWGRWCCTRSRGKLLERGENSLNYLNSRYREDRTAITSDRSANFNTSAPSHPLRHPLPLFPPTLLPVYVPPRSPVAGLRDAEPAYRYGGWTFGVACRGWIVSVHARMRTYNSADVFDAGIFPSPAVRRREGRGKGVGSTPGEKKKELVSAQQEARCSGG